MNTATWTPKPNTVAPLVLLRTLAGYPELSERLRYLGGFFLTRARPACIDHETCAPFEQPMAASTRRR